MITKQLDNRLPSVRINGRIVDDYECLLERELRVRDIIILEELYWTIMKGYPLRKNNMKEKEYEELVEKDLIILADSQYKMKVSLGKKGTRLYRILSEIVV